MEKTTDKELCLFCDKGETQVKTMVAGPRGRVCDECTELSMDVVIEKEYEDVAPAEIISILEAQRVRILGWLNVIDRRINELRKQ